MRKADELELHQATSYGAPLPSLNSHHQLLLACPPHLMQFSVSAWGVGNMKHANVTAKNPLWKLVFKCFLSLVSNTSQEPSKTPGMPPLSRLLILIFSFFSHLVLRCKNHNLDPLEFFVDSFTCSQLEFIFDSCLSLLTHRV